MKVLFVHMSKTVRGAGGEVLQHQIMVPPIGIWSLADAAASLGHDVEIIHAGIERLLDPQFSVADCAARAGADLVCFALHWHHQLLEVLKSSQAVKRTCPGAKILLGGLTASYFAEEIMSWWAHVDYVVWGEAEAAMETLLMRGFGAAADAPNLSWRDDDGNPVHNPVINCMLECTPASRFEAHSHVNLSLMRNHDYYRGRYFFEPGGGETFERWRRSTRTWYLFTGRGCSVDCAFCGGGRRAHAALGGRKSIAMRTPEAVFADMKFLHEEHETDIFHICWHPPRMSNAYYKELFKLIRGEMNVSMIFEYYNQRPDAGFVREFARAFEPDNSQIILSPTAFTEAARRRLAPSAFSDETMLAFIEKTQERGINTVLFYSPLPLESKRDTMRGARFAAKLLDRFERLSVIVMPIEMEPMSLWNYYPRKYGIENTRSTLGDYLEHHAKERPLLTDEDLGYRFPRYEETMAELKSLSGNPRWLCYYPMITNTLRPVARE